MGKRRKDGTGGRSLRFLWMKITLDELEEPIAVAETRIELAEMCNVKPETISESISRAKKLGHRCQYIRIPKEDEDE